MAHWFELLAELGQASYAAQVALLREGHGFSQAHANAVVMHHRGSTTSRRHGSFEEFLSELDVRHRKLIGEIFAAISKKYPSLETVIAWNQPMLKSGDDYVLGVSPAKSHLTIGPWGNGVIDAFADDLADYKTNKKTFTVPLDWRVNASLLHRLVRYRLDEIRAAKSASAKQ